MHEEALERRRLPAEVGRGDEPGRHRDDSDAGGSGGGESAAELVCEEKVGELGASVCERGVVRLRAFEHQVVEVEALGGHLGRSSLRRSSRERSGRGRSGLARAAASRVVQPGGHYDNTPFATTLQVWKQQRSQKKVSQVVDADRSFKAVLSCRPRLMASTKSDAGIAQEQRETGTLR